MPTPNYLLAPALEQLFVDKDTRELLANGRITFYKDRDRATLKPVYEYTGSPSQPQYAALPNPLYLTPAGDFDRPIYYYPYDEKGRVEQYFIVIENSAGVLQRTISAYPSVMSRTEDAEPAVNLIANGQFLLHHQLPKDDNYKAGEIRQASTAIAYGGWRYERSPDSRATDIVTFERFASNTGAPAANPRYALRFEKQIPHSGDTRSDISVTFNDVNFLASDTDKVTLGFAAKSNTGAEVAVSLLVRKNYGSHGSAVSEKPIGTLTITPSYQAFSQAFVFGDNRGKTIGPNNDDCVQLVLRVPTATVSDISLTDVVLIQGDAQSVVYPNTAPRQTLSQSLGGGFPIPNPDCSDLYLPVRLTATGLEFDRSQIGKISPCLYQKPQAGELLCDGARYETAGYSQEGIPYQRLQTRLWDEAHKTPIFGTGRDYVSAVYPASTSVTDKFRLVQNHAGEVDKAADGDKKTGFSFTQIHQGKDYQLTAVVWPNTNMVRLKTSGPGDVHDLIYARTSGFTVEADNKGGPLPDCFWIRVTGAASLAGKYFSFGLQGNRKLYYVWFTVDTKGKDPKMAGATGIQINLLATDTAQDVAAKIATALSGSQSVEIQTKDANKIPAGSYFTFASATQVFYVWYQIAGVGNDPKPENHTPIAVSLTKADNALTVIHKTIAGINGKYFAVPDLRGLFIRGWDHGAGVDPDVATRYSKVPYQQGDQIGTLQDDAVRYHDHCYGSPTTVVSGGVTAGVTTNASTNQTTSVGEAESRPKNMTFNYVIHY